MSEFNLSDEIGVHNCKILKCNFGGEDNQKMLFVKDVKEFIKKENNLIEEDFMMRVIGRLSAKGINYVRLIKDLILLDFKYLKAERFKLAGDKLI